MHLELSFRFPCSALIVSSTDLRICSDNYIIPLAKKLEECNVFGVSSSECLDYAKQNRLEWEKKGESIVQEMKKKYTTSNNSSGTVVPQGPGPVPKLDLHASA